MFVLRVPFPDSSPGSHRYWRIFIQSNDGHASATDVAEVEFHTSVGGADVTSGGTAIAGGGTGGSPSNAFDNSISTSWDVGGTSNTWIGYDFGAGNEKNIVEFSLSCTTSSSAVPGMAKVFQLEYSDDGSTWTLSQGPFTASLWIRGETRTFPETLAAGFHRYWRLMLLTQNGGTSQFRVNEIEFRATSGGADQCVNVGSTLNSTTGRIISTSGDSSPYRAYDNTWVDYWYGQGATNRYNGQVFLSPIQVQEISVECHTATTSNTPATAEIQYSDDGVSWTAQKSLTFAAWTANTAQVLAAI